MSADVAAERLTNAITRLEAASGARLAKMQEELDSARQAVINASTSTATINGLSAEIERLKAERDAQSSTISSLKSAQSTDQTLAAENQRLRTALQEAMANVDTILAELNGKI
jgi:septal ring factor EnvC (AmiA/AmiB activator)